MQSTRADIPTHVRTQSQQPKRVILPDTDRQKKAKERRKDLDRVRDQRVRDRNMSVIEFFRNVPDDAAAVRWFEDLLWKDGPKCPKCKGFDCYRVVSGKPLSHRCRRCRKYFSVTSGTVMHGTELTLQKWALAVYLMLSHPKGVAACQIARDVGVTEKTAWHLMHRVREGLLVNPDDLPLMSGKVEVDETFSGGSLNRMHAKQRKEWASKWANKTTVVGLLERATGRVWIVPVPDDKHDTLLGVIEDRVAPGAIIYTDGHRAYKRLPDFGYAHDNVVHSKGEYVKYVDEEPEVHTNGIESRWALFKKTLGGTFHSPSAGHLFRYAAEQAYRNNEGPANDFEAIGAVVSLMEGKRLTFRQLVDGKTLNIETVDTRGVDIDRKDDEKIEFTESGDLQLAPGVQIRKERLDENGRIIPFASEDTKPLAEAAC